MKILVFDSGPIITLALTNLLWVLPKLKQKFNGRFVVPESVKKEILDRPLRSQKFKFEAIQILNLIETNVIEVISDKDVESKAKQLVDEANKIFRGFGHNIKLIQEGEMQAMALAALYNADGVVVDERVTRTLIEYPYGLKKLMERKLHTRLSVNKSLLAKLSDELDDIYLIRSIELMSVAFEQGFLDKYLVPKKVTKRDLLESMLWALRFSGCSISNDDINQIIREEIR